MNIGVFGDSFSTRSKFDITDDFWVDIVHEKYQLKNYSMEGTNLYWSYSMLQKYSSEFDLLLLTVTGPNRFYVPLAKSIKVKNAFNIQAIEFLLRTPSEFDEEDVNILNALKQYMIHAMDIQQYALYHSLIVEKIKSEFPNIILIPTVPLSMDPVKEYTQASNITAMSNIAMIDFEYCNLSWEDVRADKRNAHLSSENNVIFGKEMLKYIEGDRIKPFEIDLSMYKKPTISKKEFIEKYFNTRYNQ
jgi:hypothetical protein